MIHHEHPQNTPEWMAARLGLPTASMASSLVTPAKLVPSTSVKPYATKLAADLFAGFELDAWEGNDATERGHELESAAAAYYSFERDIDVIECGFFTDDKATFGASPDRLVGDKGLLEIKNQKAAGHVKTLLAYTSKKEIPKDYKLQPQMQMMTSEREWVDLVLYHPDLPKSIIRIERDDKICKLLSEQIVIVNQLRDDALGALLKLQEAA